jgi:predicted ATPase/DNA-binding SARP family transcriptional activator
MSELALHLLGAPEVMREGEPVGGFRSVKARALLFYVAARNLPQPRARLAGLLWGDLSERNANANLRKTLTNLRRLAGPHLAITRDAVAIEQANPPWLDVRQFETALDTGGPASLEKAIDLYRGDFLDGFYVGGAPDFEAWQLAERYRLRERLLAALHRLAEREAGLGNLAAAIGHAQHLLALDALREDAHRLLMALFARDGQRARALAQYAACADLLAAELGVEPGEKTRTLFQQIRDGGFVPPPIAAPRHNLRAPLTSFVGRQEELACVARWLAEPAGRLITVTGPGGVGKTRLTQQAAWDAIDAFGDDVWAVSLASLDDVAGVATAVAATLGITLFGKAGPQAQVARFLRRKRLLLLLDNAEHLISQALADFIVEILTQAPDVKIMVASRERLQMQAEQVLNLSGLAYPPEETTLAASTYPAGQLFLQRAEGHGQPLPRTLETDETIQRLCRLVDGLPLALELAATWTPAMPLAEIVSAIERGLDLLATDMHDVSPRHRNIHAVFDTSWQMLRADERRIMRQLATFRGDFSAAAAADVVGASAAQLQLLTNKSLLRARHRGGLSDGRYDMHELIRQYAAPKLASRPDEAEALARRHGRYYAAFLAGREKAILGADYLQAKAEIEAEVDNVRKAWEWAVAACSLEDIARSADTLHYYFLNTQGLFGEAAQRFQQAAEQLAAHAAGDAEPLVGRLLLKAAANRRMLGELEAAGRLAEESLSLFYRHELEVDVAHATSTLGVIRLQQNEKEKALRLAVRAVDLAREQNSPVDLCLCLNNLAYVLAHNGNHQEATTIAEESLALARALDFPHGELSAMNMLGVYYQAASELDKAEMIFDELVARCRDAGTQSRLAQAVNNLGSLHKKRGESGKALPLLQEAVRIYDAVGQTHYAAFVRVMLGELALEQSGFDAARRYCLQALQTAQELEIPSLALSALELYARLLANRQQKEAAVAVLAFVVRHPATLADYREDARRTIQSFREMMSSQDYKAAADKGAVWTLDQIIAEAVIYCSTP